MVWHPLDNAKYCESVDVQLEEWEQERTKGLERGFALPLALMCCLEREKLESF